MKKILIMLLIGMTFSSCFLEVQETCGTVTKYGVNYNGGYVVIEGDLIYVNDLFFSTVDIGDDVCVTH